MAVQRPGWSGSVVRFPPCSPEHADRGNCGCCSGYKNRTGRCCAGHWQPGPEPHEAEI